MKRVTLNYAIDIGLAVSFLSMFVTGIVKIPEIFRYFGLHRQSPMMIQISTIHDWSGILFGILAITHIILHWSWYVNMTKTIISKKK